MSEEILLRFLRYGLIDVGGDDVKLQKLQDTVSDLSAILLKSPAKTVAFALTAFDPDVTPGQPVIQEVVTALEKQWPTYVNTFSGTPMTVIRAMLLASLALAAKKDDRIAAALVACARNTLPYVTVGDEQPIWRDLVVDLEKEVERLAEAAWTTPDSIQVPPLALSVPSLTIPTKYFKLNRDALTKGLSAASGPSDASGEPGTDPNPHWPNTGHHWSHAFASRAATAIADAVDPALKVGVGPVDLSDSLEGVAETISQHVNTSLEAVSRATIGLQRRTYLLWWKEALYSPSLRRSYRDLPGPRAAVLMAFDLHNQVPTLTPLSVSAFLYETVRALPQIDVEERKPLLDMLKDAAASEELADLRASIKTFNLGEGRGPLLAVVGSHEAATMAPAHFKTLTGVPADTALSLPDLAVWLFRELQASRAIINDSAPRRRARKA